MEELKFIPHSSFIEIAKVFTKEYNLVDILETGHPDFKKPKKGKREGLCRFCNKDHTNEVFSEAVHLVSKYLSNTDLYSIYECNTCNHKFGEYESDLANYLGISRTILGLSNVQKAAGFVVKGLKVKSRIYVGKNLLIVSKRELNEENSPEDRKAGITKLTFNKPPYIPTNVYKALVKATLSILPEQEVKKNYLIGLGYLQGLVKMSGARIFGYKYPLQVNMPLHIFIFEKKNSEHNIPTHILGFYFMNYIIYLPLQFHAADMKHCASERTIHYAPPLFIEGNPVLNIMPIPFQDDLSSTEIKGNDEETLTMMVNPEELKKSSKYDQKTNQITREEYNPTDMKYLILLLSGATFTPEEIKGFIDILEKDEKEFSA